MNNPAKEGLTKGRRAEIRAEKDVAIAFKSPSSWAKKPEKKERGGETRKISLSGGESC